MSVIMVTESGEQHGLINSLPNSIPDTGFKSMEPETRSKAEKLRKEESKMVKARYINHRGMHERLSKPYMRYAGDMIKMYHLIPGYTYELPLGFVKEVNESRGLEQRSDAVVDGKIRGKDSNPLKIHELVPVSW